MGVWGCMQSSLRSKGLRLGLGGGSELGNLAGDRSNPQHRRVPNPEAHNAEPKS